MQGVKQARSNIRGDSSCKVWVNCLVGYPEALDPTVDADEAGMTDDKVKSRDTDECARLLEGA